MIEYSRKLNTEAKKAKISIVGKYVFFISD